MITISLCMIVRNEQDTLERCLKSIADLVDEIIIVDTGSTDRTKDIAKSYTNKIFDFQWVDDFAAARNFSFSKAVMDYIIWLDADDVLLDTDRVKFSGLKETLDSKVDVVMMLYNAGVDETGNITLSYLRERLLKRSSNFEWHEPVHEYIQPRGIIIQSDIAITHQKLHSTPSDRNLQIYQNMIRKGIQLTPRSQLYYGMELFNHQQYSETISELQQFLDSGQGWFEDNIKACYYLGKCHSLLEQSSKALEAFFKSFSFDLPRAEICCEIGYLFKKNEDLTKACFWFELATKLQKPSDGWGFIYHDYWGFIPYLELCVCYYKLGNLKKAKLFNEKAGIIKPNDPAVLFNKQFFKQYKPGK